MAVKVVVRVAVMGEVKVGVERAVGAMAVGMEVARAAAREVAKAEAARAAAMVAVATVVAKGGATVVATVEGAKAAEMAVAAMVVGKVVAMVAVAMVVATGVATEVAARVVDLGAIVVVPVGLAANLRWRRCHSSQGCIEAFQRASTSRSLVLGWPNTCMRMPGCTDASCTC